MNTKRSSSNYRVLIFDDEEPTLRLATRVIETGLGCVVWPCQNYASMMHRLDEQLPDLILLDVKLKDLSGITICRELKKNPKLRPIPIIFFSARKEPKTRIDALDAGGVDFIEKPFYPKELLMRVQGYVALHRSQNELEFMLSEKQALIRVLCHDLKNPIAAAQTVLNYMAEVEGIESESIEIAHQACKSSLELIEYVRMSRDLSNANLDDGTLGIRVSEAFRESAKLMRPIARDKNIKLIFSPEDSYEILSEEQLADDFCIDVNRVVLIHHILNSLISNAIKFSHPESEVRISARKLDVAGQPMCEIVVSDSGIGIPKAMIQSLFDKGVYAPRKGTAGENGTGFGMPLVKFHIERSRGFMFVESSESEKNSGTQITLHFRLSKDQTLSHNPETVIGTSHHQN